LVEQVRTDLLDEIGSGKLVVGDKLPNEYELADRFEVSRPTVREAIQSLIETGHLMRQRGNGTFVTAPPIRHALEINVYYTAMIQEAGLEPSETVLQMNWRPATEDEATALELDRPETVLEVERIRLGDGRPLIYSRDRIPADILGEPTEELLSHSLYVVLDLAGHHPVRATSRLIPTVADARLARHLKVRRGAPLLHIHQVDRDSDGRAVMESDEWHRADAFDLIINRRAPLSG
jgi:GntR family transcriptional regulator